MSIRKDLITVLMKRDGLTRKEAEKRVADVKGQLMDRLGDGEMPFDICEEEFGLEPDYLEDLIG
jgi:hypothetical protein